MTPEQIQLLVDTVNSAAAVLSGFVCALIFAVTWKG